MILYLLLYTVESSLLLHNYSLNWWSPRHEVWVTPCTTHIRHGVRVTVLATSDYGHPTLYTESYSEEFVLSYGLSTDNLQKQSSSQKCHKPEKEEETRLKTEHMHGQQTLYKSRWTGECVDGWMVCFGRTENGSIPRRHRHIKHEVSIKF